jgi:uncharacterized SAM-binding protein YcdF (DUF218 family)
MRRSRRAAAFVEYLGLATLVALLALSFTPLADVVSHAMSVPARLEPADAIVVLGAGVRRDGTLSNSSLRRTIRGIDLYRRGLAKILVFTGPRNRSAHAEAEVRSVLAMQFGVPSAAIVLETTARTTREEADRVAALLRHRGLSRILLVADVEGMRRATAVFQRVGFDVLPAPAEQMSLAEGGPGGRLLLTRAILMELVALAYYRASGYIQ